jgi:hypothetical protein
MRFKHFIVLATLSSCALKPKIIDEPEDLIPQDSMVMIMHDMSILESYIHHKYVQLERYAMLLRMSGDSLLKEYGVSRDRYESSMTYYGKNPQCFIEIYDSIMSKLEGNKVNSNPFESSKEIQFEGDNSNFK